MLLTPAFAEPAFDFPKIADVRREAASVPTPTSRLGACPATGSLLEQIAMARACVANQPAGFADKSGNVRRVALAILDATGLIRLVQIQQALKGDIKVLQGNVRLVLRRNNRINSDFEVIDPPGGKVLSVRYPHARNDLRIYTPYSPELAQPEVFNAGLQVKDDFIDRALARLRAANVPSRAFPGKLVADVVSRKILTILLLIEHINPKDFQSAELTEAQVGKVLVILAANKELAYAHNISPAGAGGIAQLMRGTYADVVAAYRSAPLEKNFERSAADPINAIMVQILLCDYDWSRVNEFSKPAEISAERIGPYLAACYNGGCSPVKRAFQEGMASWIEAPDLENPPTSKEPFLTYVGEGKKRHPEWTTSIFKPETLKYVLFYKWVREHLEKIGADGFTPAPPVKI